jgi:hypothetical protein
MSNTARYRFNRYIGYLSQNCSFTIILHSYEQQFGIVVNMLALCCAGTLLGNFYRTEALCIVRYHFASLQGESSHAILNTYNCIERSVAVSFVGDDRSLVSIFISAFGTGMAKPGNDTLNMVDLTIGHTR